MNLLIAFVSSSRPHREQVCHERGEAGGEAGLRDEAQLELGEADHVVPVTEAPARDVHQVGLHQHQGQSRSC